MPLPSCLACQARAAAISAAVALAFSCFSSLAQAQESETPTNPAQGKNAAAPVDTTTPVRAPNPTQPGPKRGVTTEVGASDQFDITVTAARLDAARNQINTAVGASNYEISREAIETQPLGSNASLSTTLLQAPGVAQDSFGQLHVRGDHAEFQYRINGVIVPETISGFSQLFDTRFARRIDLITGALPAEYGYRTAGVVDIETRSGTLEPGERSRFTAGSGRLSSRAFPMAARPARSITSLREAICKTISALKTRPIRSIR